MKRNHILLLLLIMLISTLALLLILHTLLKKDPPISIQPQSTIIEDSMDLPQASPAATITPEPSASPTPLPTKENDDPYIYATLTIQTNKRTKTFDIYPDVEEATLDTHIGHMPSSANPGEAGLCVLMGHRDRELKILKYSKIGDIFTIQKNGIDYRYHVTDIEIQNNSVPLTFPVTDTLSLAIVTCYPFDFLGPAPQRVIVYCMLTK